MVLRGPAEGEVGSVAMRRSGGKGLLLRLLAVEDVWVGMVTGCALRVCSWLTAEGKEEGNKIFTLEARLGDSESGGVQRCHEEESCVCAASRRLFRRRTEKITDYRRGQAAGWQERTGQCVQAYTYVRALVST